MLKIDRLIFKKNNAPDSEPMLGAPVVEIFAIIIFFISIFFILWTRRLRNQTKIDVSTGQYIELVIIGLIAILPLLVIDIIALMASVSKTIEYFSL